MSKTTTKAPFIVAGDLGYGNVKMAYGVASKGVQHAECYPATAIPNTELPRPSMDFGDTLFEKSVAAIGDVAWAVGFEMSMVSKYVRPKSDGYIYTDHYKALFYSTLIRQPSEVIDLYVTGLPVEQFKDEKYVEDLKALMIGTHQVSKNRTVTIKAVVVLPQPVGAYFHFVSEIASHEDLKLIKQGVVAACDPGYYTWNFTAFKKGRMRVKSSSHSQSAMSYVLRECCEIMRDDEGGACSPADIEEALQRGEHEIAACGRIINFDGYLERASKTIGHTAAQEVLNAFSDEGEIMLIVLAGGGAPFYKASMERAFPNARVHEVGINAIAKGYLARGAALLHAPSIEKSA